jgi:hypothetical protein
MEPTPRFFARFPHHFPKGPSRVFQCHDKQPGPSVFSAAMKRCSPGPIINLSFFARKKLQPVILSGIRFLQPPDKALHAIVFMREPKAFHQILIDGCGITAQPYLFLDPIPMGLTGATSVFGQFFFRSRWPGWGILTRFILYPGGHLLSGGGFCTKILLACWQTIQPVIFSNGLAINPRCPVDLPLADKVKLPKLKIGQPTTYRIQKRDQVSSKAETEDEKFSEEAIQILAHINAGKPIKVAKRLAAPHPMMEKTRQILSKSGTDQYGILTGSWKKSVLDIRVSSNMLSRALRIFDAIIKYFNRQAVPVVVENAHRCRNSGIQTGYLGSIPQRICFLDALGQSPCRSAGPADQRVAVRK